MVPGQRAGPKLETTIRANLKGLGCE